MPHLQVLSASQGGEAQSSTCRAVQNVKALMVTQMTPGQTPIPSPHPTKPVKMQLPTRDAWETLGEQRPLGQLTSDPTFLLPLRQVS